MRRVWKVLMDDMVEQARRELLGPIDPHLFVYIYNLTQYGIVCKSKKYIFKFKVLSFLSIINWNTHILTSFKIYTGSSAPLGNQLNWSRRFTWPFITLFSLSLFSLSPLIAFPSLQGYTGSWALVF